MQAWSLGCFGLHLQCTQPLNRETVSTDLAPFTWFPRRVFTSPNSGQPDCPSRIRLDERRYWTKPELPTGA